jgi:hypothetical protein
VKLIYAMIYEKTIVSCILVSQKSVACKRKIELTQNVHLGCLYNKLENIDTDYKTMAWHKWLHGFNLDLDCKEIRQI